MSQRLTFISHGATAATQRAAFPADEPLEEPALVQAASLRDRLRRADRALTSPLLRARQTAEALCLDAREEPALRDLDHGRWAGRALGEIEAAEPGAVQAWLHDAGAAPHGGEAVSDLLLRVAAWMGGYGGETGHTVIVTHAAVIRAAILHVLDAPAGSFWRVDVAPLSVTDIRHDGRRWALRAVNQIVG